MLPPDAGSPHRRWGDLEALINFEDPYDVVLPLLSMTRDGLKVDGMQVT